MSLLSSIISPKARPQLPPPGVALSLLSESIENRKKLASLEIEEARDHAVVSTLLAAGTAALILLTGFALTLLVASLIWESPHRVAWMLGVCAFYCAAAIGIGSALRQRLRNWQPFKETHTQLEEDFQCLSKLIKASIH